MHNEHDIAIIGVACRLPGKSNTPLDFWKVLKNKVDTIIDIPNTRAAWNKNKFFSLKQTKGKYYVSTGAFLEEDIINKFDAEFFRMSAREADNLDPQQRILLEVTWEALENAYIVPSTLEKSNTSVFIGIHWDDYSSERYYLSNTKEINAYSTLSNLRSLSAGRISYFFDFQGQSMEIDTACSSGLVSMILACQALQNKSTNLCIVGGISLLLSPHLTIGFCQMNVLSKDGRSKTFSASADGFAQGEGCNVFILKRLPDAIKDKNNILAIIKGTAINHDGRSLTITTPSNIAQQNMLKSAIKNANITQDKIDYIETHGTGTSLGDYIEVSALSSVFKNRENPLLIGSVKTNIGHLGANAGLVSVMKIILSMQNNSIPANLHFNIPNKRIAWNKNKFIVPTNTHEWNQNKNKIAGVSAFGMSGTNAHIILEEYYNTNHHIQKNITHNIFCLSAKTKHSLLHQTHKYQNYIKNIPEHNLPDMCYLACTGREHFINYRLATVIDSKSDLQNKFKQHLSNEYSQKNIFTSNNNHILKHITFVFTGQGSQYYNMGYEIYNEFAIFKKYIDICNKILTQFLDVSLINILFENSNLIHKTRYTQPALFAFEYSLYKLWESFGITPTIVLGHSVGEYVAACVSGILSLEDGLKLIAYRGKLIEELASTKQGSMLSILTDIQTIQSFIHKYPNDISIAAINGKSNIVISGTESIINIIQTQLKKQNIITQKLQVSHAFHSPLMKPMLTKFSEIAQTIKYNIPKITTISNVTNTKFTQEILNYQYWIKHVIQPVNFLQSIQNIITETNTKHFIEIGPRPILCNIITNIIKNNNKQLHEYQCIPSTNINSSLLTLKTSIAKLYSQGANITWSKVFPEQNYNKKLHLPNYQFDKKYHWTEIIPDNVPKKNHIQIKHPLLQAHIISSSLQTNEWQFEAELSLEHAYISDHRVFNKIICPASAYIEMMLFTGNYITQKPIILEEISINKPLEITQKELIQINITKHNDITNCSIYRFLNTKNNPHWNKYVSGKIKFINNINKPDSINLNKIQNKLTQYKNISDFYSELKIKGMNINIYSIQKLWHGDGEALGLIQIKEEYINNQYLLNPLLLDASFHVLLAGLPLNADQNKLHLPIGYESFTFFKYPTSKVYSYVVYNNNQNTTILIATLYLLNSTGEILAKLTGCKLRKTNTKNVKEQSNIAKYLYHTKWYISDQNKKNNINDTYLIIPDDLNITHHLTQKLQQEQKTFHLLSNLTKDNINKLINHNFSKILYMFNISNNKTKQSDLTSLLYIAQLLKIKNIHSELWIFSIGVQNTPNDNFVPNIWQSNILGFTKTLTLENINNKIKSIDLDPNQNDQENSTSILNELSLSSEDTQIVYRKNIRFIPKVEQYSLNNNEKHKNQILRLSKYGLLKELYFNTEDTIPLKNNEVKIKILSSGINFRDILRALGMMKTLENKQANDIAFGFECSGIIQEIGNQTKKFKIGDQVLAYSGTASIATEININENLVTHKPQNITFAEAATIPVAYLTSYYGLIECAKLKKTDKILIHNAAGGVGQAAIQIAKHIGAEIFTTAHPDKWYFLKNLGIKNIYSSRNFDFANQILQDTKGQGVNVILNSLNDKFIDHSIKTLSHTGRFIEIGKLLVWTKTKFLQHKPQGKFYIFDLGEMTATTISTIFHKVITLIKEKHILPLKVTEFNHHDIQSAFKYMQKAKQIGKIAVTFPQRISRKTSFADSKGSYLITGGLGGLGIAIMKLLTTKGGKNIILVSRKNPNKDIKNIIQQYTQNGINIKIILGDISNFEQTKKIIQQCKNLKGIIHAAGILNDALIINQNINTINQVSLAKIQGTWNLHLATQNLKLDYFICFSSVASLIGSVGQSNYSAANAFLDQFSYYRNYHQLPCVTINWGPWDEIGMAVKLKKYLNSQGYQLLPVEVGLNALEQIIQHINIPQIAVLYMDWNAFISKLPTKLPLLSKLQTTTTTKQNINSQFINILKNTPEEDKIDILINRIETHIKNIIGLNQNTNINDKTSLFDLGLDSLMAVELKNMLEQDLQQTLRSTLLFDYPNIQLLVSYLQKEVAILHKKDNIVTPQTQENKNINTQNITVENLEKLMEEL